MWGVGMIKFITFYDFGDFCDIAVVPMSSFLFQFLRTKIEDIPYVYNTYNEQYLHTFYRQVHTRLD